jgi:hypothetical protein
MSRKPTLPSNEASPAVTFSPEAMAALLNEVSEGRKLIAKLSEAATAQTQAANTKPGKAPTMSIAGKSERAIRNELDCIKLFKKAGFGVVVPHVDVRTFNRWMAVGLRPVEGSKSTRVGNLRLFHKSQCRVVTSDETAKSVEQQKAAIDRHTADLAKAPAPAAKAPKGKAKATVHHLPQ